MTYSGMNEAQDRRVHLICLDFRNSIAAVIESLNLCVAVIVDSSAVEVLVHQCISTMQRKGGSSISVPQHVNAAVHYSDFFF